MRSGLSNSHFQDSYCPPAPRIGVDTISWGWKDGAAVERFLRLDGLVHGPDHRPLRIIPTVGGAMRLNRRLDGLGTVGAFPGASMLFVEGRARALERADEHDHGLGRLRQLPDLEAQVADKLGSLLGRAPSERAALRRADLAGELAFDRGEDGAELLDIIAALPGSRHKLHSISARGGTAKETVYWRTPKRSVAVLRAYDKGIESDTAVAGERIRLERQLRYQSGTRPSVSQFLARDLAQTYIQPIRRWIRHGIVAGTADQLVRTLTDAALIWPNWWCSGSSWASGSGTVHETMWAPRRVERILGTVSLNEIYGGGWPAWSPKQRQRRLAEVSELGIVLTAKPAHVDVDAALESLCDLWRRAA